MKLLIIRHADAGPHDPARYPDDTLRPITAKGRKQHRKVAKRLGRRDLVPELLLASPWLRAWETAEVTSAETGCPAPVACEALAQAPDLAKLGRVIGARDPDAVIALVGHEPWTGELAALLLAGEKRGMAIDFPKSGVMGLTLDTLAAGEATLTFFWRPKGD